MSPEPYAGRGRFQAAAESAAGGAGVGVWSALVAGVGLAVVGLVGLALAQPWVFPSLGPTLMVMAETPRQPAGRPRNVAVGHVVGVAAGYLALLVTGLADDPPVIEQGLTGPRVVAAVLSLTLTAFVLQALRSSHPPAGATTLIVSLGLLRTPQQLLVILLAVLLVTAVAVLLNLAARIRQEGVGGRPG